MTGVWPGDRVTVWPIYYCGKCSACGKGMYNSTAGANPDTGIVVTNSISVQSLTLLRER